MHQKSKCSLLATTLALAIFFSFGTVLAETVPNEATLEKAVANAAESQTNWLHQVVREGAVKSLVLLEDGGYAVEMLVHEKYDQKFRMLFFMYHLPEQGLYYKVDTVIDGFHYKGTIERQQELYTRNGVAYYQYSGNLMGYNVDLYSPFSKTGSKLQAELREQAGVKE